MKKFSGGNFFFAPINSSDNDQPRLPDAEISENAPEDIPVETAPKKLSEQASSYLRMSREHDRILGELLSKKGK